GNRPAGRRDTAPPRPRRGGAAPGLAARSPRHTAGGGAARAVVRGDRGCAAVTRAAGGPALGRVADGGGLAGRRRAAGRRPGRGRAAAFAGPGARPAGPGRWG